jgi:NAD(P)-dependent dehydrogenase (short-subunit alcohol dehydrogenase family)
MTLSTALKGKNVLVTGATGGLGGAVIDVLAAAGANVYVPARGAVPVGAKAAPATNVTDEAQVEALYRALPPLWASVHLVGGFAMKPLVDTTMNDVTTQLDINFASAFLCTREAAKSMLANGGGRIVNVASHAAETLPAQMAAYAASKAAVIAMTKSAAAELYAKGVFVNAVAPTIIDTPANRAAMPNAPRDKWAAPSSIAEAIAWLASPENTAVSGSVVTVGG